MEPTEIIPGDIKNLYQMVFELQDRVSALEKAAELLVTPDALTSEQAEEYNAQYDRLRAQILAETARG